MPMICKFRANTWLGALLVLLLTLVADTQAAYAQSANCSQLVNTLEALTRNSDFRSLRQNSEQARGLAGQLQEAESVFVREGCQQQLNAGARLSRDCRTVARRIIQGREAYNQLAAKIETGQAVAQQRELTLQQVARFGCGTGSSATVTNNVRSSRGNLFDRLFGGGQDDFIEDNDYYLYGGIPTLRTVCVRACDGYYWPVSFSTISDYLGDDSAQCQSQCPGADVELYYYRNPGEDPDDMVNLNGTPYRSLPNAFRYRQEYDSACSCRQQIEYGAITVNVDYEGGTRAEVSIGDLNFPLPMRDPRRTSTTVVAEVIAVPLPRRRPLRAGEEAPEREAPTVRTEARYTQQGDKRVRIVGPLTPYVQ